MFIIFLSSLERERERDYVLKDYSFTTVMPVRTRWMLLYCAVCTKQINGCTRLCEMNIDTENQHERTKIPFLKQMWITMLSPHLAALNVGRNIWPGVVERSIQHILEFVFCKDFPIFCSVWSVFNQESTSIVEHPCL